MVELNKLFLVKKLLSAATIAGCCCGLFSAAMTEYLPEKPLWTHIVFFIILLFSGVAVGSAAKVLNKKDRGLLVNKNINGDMLISKQRVYLITPLVMVMVYFMFLNAVLQSRLGIVFLSGGVFMLSLSGGLFDQLTKKAKKLVMYGTIPLSISFIFVLTSNDQNLKQLIWLMGFLFLMTALITTSTVQLNIKIFRSKDINLKNSKKIRIFNYSMVTVFSLFCVTAVFYRKMAAGISIGLRSASIWLIGIFTKLSVWIAGDTSIAYADPSEAPERIIEATPTAVAGAPMKFYVSPSPVPIQESGNATSWFQSLINRLLSWIRGGDLPDNVLSSQEIQEIAGIVQLPAAADQQTGLVQEVASATRINIENMLMLALFVLFVVTVIAIILFAAKIIRRGINLTMSEGSTEIIEYDEENEILKTESGIIISKKNKFTRKGLAEQKGEAEKIRYLYGFILERLHKRKLSIRYSDTPEEIYEKTLQYANGEKLDEIGFNELTKKYSRVRYGNKLVNIEANLSALAEKYEKAIEIIE